MSVNIYISYILYIFFRKTYILYNKDIIVNLYKLHFPSSPFSLQPNKKNFHSSNQTYTRENQIFYILPLFHPPINFPSFYFSTPLTKWTLIIHISIGSSLNPKLKLVEGKIACSFFEQ